MKIGKIDNKGTGKIFNNSFLEKLTKTNFLIPVVMYYVFSVACIIYAVFFTQVNMWHFIYMFPSGLIVFTLVEYLIHRYLFHFTPHSEKQEQLLYTIHGVHHEFPKDKDRLVMPPLMSILLALLFYVVFRIMVGEYVWLFFPGFLSGYSTYLIIHYAVHRYRPPSNFLKVLWRHHSLHHYKSDQTAYSVSFPLWDYLFGTMPSRASSSDKKAADRLPDYQD